MARSPHVRVYGERDGRFAVGKRRAAVIWSESFMDDVSSAAGVGALGQGYGPCHDLRVMMKTYLSNEEYQVRVPPVESWDAPQKTSRTLSPSKRNQIIHESRNVRSKRGTCTHTCIQTRGGRLSVCLR